MNLIDLRSDTVTKPTQDMLKAMCNAEVGDDVYGEDPTVQRLEAKAAEVMGKQAALLVTSGTMGNLVAVLTHTNKGQEVLLEADSHIYFYEVGGMAAVGGLMPRLINGEKGKITEDKLLNALRPGNIHFPQPALLCLENTHNRAGGVVSTPAEIGKVAALAHQHGLKVHLDGARIFNAATALQVAPAEAVEQCDSVMFCLSKGLGAPVGSMLAGSSDFIARARKWRKMLGGGMRQAGVLAAAGLVALEQMVERLIEDHANAKLLAEGLAALPKLSVDPAGVQTNIVVAQLDSSLGGAAKILAELSQRGVLASDFGRDTLRFVTHKDVAQQDVLQALQIISEVIR